METTSTLDLFLLRLIDSGIDTPYQFRERVGLSVGATLPALKRLEAAGLIDRKAKALRNKQQYTITRAGRHHLRSHMQISFHQIENQRFADSESVLRMVSLAASADETKAALTCLRLAVQDRQRRATHLLNSTYHGTDLAGRYSRWISLIQSARFKVEADTLAAIGSELSGQKPPTRSQSRRRSRT
jgi:DNA-binding PadR family transcriptional regulator